MTVQVDAITTPLAANPSIAVLGMPAGNTVTDAPFAQLLAIAQTLPDVPVALPAEAKPQPSGVGEQPPPDRDTQTASEAEPLEPLDLTEPANVASEGVLLLPLVAVLQPMAQAESVKAVEDGQSSPGTAAGTPSLVVAADSLVTQMPEPAKQPEPKATAIHIGEQRHTEMVSLRSDVPQGTETVQRHVAEGQVTYNELMSGGRLTGADIATEPWTADSEQVLRNTVLQPQPSAMPVASAQQVHARTMPTEIVPPQATSPNVSATQHASEAVVAEQYATASSQANTGVSPTTEPRFTDANRSGADGRHGSTDQRLRVEPRRSRAIGNTSTEEQTPIRSMSGLEASVAAQQSVVSSRPEAETSPLEVVRQVVRSIDALVEHRSPERVTLQLEPEHLGKLQITVTVRDGAIHTHIVADNHVIRQMLENHSALLQQALQQRGLHLEALQVSVQSDTRQFYLNQPYVPQPSIEGSQYANTNVASMLDPTLTLTAPGVLNLLA